MKLCVGRLSLAGMNSRVAEVLIPLVGASVVETMLIGHRWIEAREDR